MQNLRLFNGKPQASATKNTDACGLPLRSFARILVQPCLADKLAIHCNFASK